jgi:MinD-like ATPase involved in chromosome partitioning or flagellar assembly
VVTFDDALPTLLRTCEQAPGFTALATACVVRDLRGRLRLLIDPAPVVPAAPQPSVDVAALEAQLTQELGEYFAPPVWSTRSARRDEARLAGVLIGKATEWPAPTFVDLVSGVTVTSRVRWKKLERRLSKQAWLESSGSKPPWDLAATTPSIVTFYSFKGGVGRTTALLACAWQLARAGKKVVVIDLDLEAPGLGTLCEAKTDRGVVDLLVDRLATGSGGLDGAIAERAPAFGADGERISVIPAGRLDGAYLEKLARLDFVGDSSPVTLLGAAGGTGGQSPIEEALRNILLAVRRLGPDYILLDSRAGLHDLAGLSLHNLAHVDVLVGRATEQCYVGFDLTLGVLAKRKGAANLQCVVTHTFAPMAGTPEAPFEEAEFLRRSYASFAQNVYGLEQAQTIAETDAGQHAPVVIRRHAELDRFTGISTIESVLFAPDFVNLRKEIEARCATEGDG